MRRALLVPLLLACAVAGLLAPGARSETTPTTGCTQFHPEQFTDEKDAAFIGRVLDERRDPAVEGGYVYRFEVVRPLKGEETLGSQVDVHAAQRLTNDREPLIDYPDLDVGVMFELDGATPTMSVCDLVPAVDLISALDKPKGQVIMLVIGIILLIAVLTFSTVRLKRKQRRQEAAQG